MVWKASQTIPKAHVQPIPALEEPFSKIIIDCVGSLPKTIVNMFDSNACFHTFIEAILIRNIKTKTHS